MKLGSIEWCFGIVEEKNTCQFKVVYPVKTFKNEENINRKIGAITLSLMKQTKLKGLPLSGIYKNGGNILTVMFINETIN